MESLLATGTASQADAAGSSVVYKLLGCGQDDDNYDM